MSYVELADIGKHWLQLNSLQQMYVVIFPILYGIMLNGCMGLELFHFGELFDDVEKVYARRRIIFSIIIINGLPIAFFACTFLGLGDIDTELNFFKIVGLFCISFSVFVFYRILHALFSCKKGNCFYSTCMRARMLKKREISFSIKGHLIGVLIYAMIVIIGFRLIDGLFNKVKSCPFFFISLSILLIVIFVLWLLCAGPTEDGSKPPDDEDKSEKKEDDEFEQLYQESKGNILKEDLDRLLKHKLDINLRIFTWRLSLIIPVAVLANQGMEVVRSLGLFWTIIGAVFVIIYFIHFIAEFKRFIRSQTHIRYFKEYIRIRRKLKPACS